MQTHVEPTSTQFALRKSTSITTLTVYVQLTISFSSSTGEQQSRKYRGWTSVFIKDIAQK